MREDAGVSIAASQSLANCFFLLKNRKQSCPYKRGAVLPTLKAAHLNNWLHGLTSFILCFAEINSSLHASMTLDRHLNFNQVC